MVKNCEANTQWGEHRRTRLFVFFFPLLCVVSYGSCWTVSRSTYRRPNTQKEEMNECYGKEKKIENKRLEKCFSRNCYLHCNFNGILVKRCDFYWNLETKIRDIVCLSLSVCFFCGCIEFGLALRPRLIAN